MLKFLDDVPNYKADEPSTAPTNERLSQFYAFLEKANYTKFFVWIEFKNPELRWSYERCPYFYEAGKFFPPKFINIFDHSGSGQFKYKARSEPKLIKLKISL